MNKSHILSRVPRTVIKSHRYPRNFTSESCNLYMFQTQVFYPEENIEIIGSTAVFHVQNFGNTDLHNICKK